MNPQALPPDLRHRLNVARLAADVAGRIQLRGWEGADLRIETKATAIDLVTSVDRECDEAIREVLQSLCPEDAVVTEETFQEGDGFPMTGGTWLVDPIDGTTNFAHGFPHFAVSIAYLRDGQPAIGLVLDAVRGEAFVAVQGHGAWLESPRAGRPLRVSPQTDFAQALLATGFPYDTHLHPRDNMGMFLRFMVEAQGVRRAGSAALDLAYVAAGRMEGFWELRLSPWDVAAGMLLVTEAGGVVSTMEGGPLDLSQRRIHIIAANAADTRDRMVAICHEERGVSPR